MPKQRRSRVRLTPAERAELERRAASRASSQQTAYRAEIILHAADGQSDARIANDLGLAERTVWMWRRRFVEDRLNGLDPHRKARAPRRYGAAIWDRLLSLANAKPGDLDPALVGQTHWTIKDLAEYVAAHPELGLGAPGRSTIGTMLKRHSLRLDRLGNAEA